ncbi:MAG: glycerol-3-phosphate 1-O-acyltransferase PlsY [Planctomycetes bacterium]|nr:glycerol-3-phosphate 1-O-acyltransferase PlsY [Planctomycetota bacterium]
MLVVTTPLALVAGYTVGSIPVAYLAVKWRKGIDIRTVGSGNVGATNAGRVLGRRAAIAIYLADAGKGIGAVWIGRGLDVSQPLEVACGLLAILGHVFPVWLKWKGGKGVATTTGVFLALAPRAFFVAGAVWLLVAAMTRYVSLASIALAIAFPIAIVAFDRSVDERNAPLFALAIAVALFIIIRHITNIRRVLAGTEPRIFAKK